MFMDDPVDPLMAALYELIAVATDVTDMSVAHLMGNPKICESIVQRVQNIGKAWDEHSDWHGRNWYVQVLLAVASLSRVVEWWEAEKQFWNFDEQADEQDEPLMFVMKPPDEEAANLDLELEGFRLDDKPPSPALQRPKEDSISTTPASSPLPAQEVSAPTSSRATPQQEIAATESARVLATERLRLQAETAQNQNIVIELSLDGDHFIWVNHAWRVVVGWVVYQKRGAFADLYILERIQKDCPVPAYPAYLPQPIGECSKKLRTAFRRMILTQLKFDSSCRPSRVSSGIHLPEACIS
jgi:serine/threonine-protein kinase RIM15